MHVFSLFPFSSLSSEFTHDLSICPAYIITSSPVPWMMQAFDILWMKKWVNDNWIHKNTISCQYPASNFGWVSKKARKKKKGKEIKEEERKRKGKEKEGEWKESEDTCRDARETRWINLKRHKVVGGKNDSGGLQLLAFSFLPTTCSNVFQEWIDINEAALQHPSHPFFRIGERTCWREDWRSEDWSLSYRECKWDPSGSRGKEACGITQSYLN